MDAIARSMVVEALAVPLRSAVRKRKEKTWVRNWTIIIIGIEERMTRVRVGDRLKARIKVTMKVRMNWRSMPILREVARRTSSVSLWVGAQSV
jgi:hypothetical protein